jgi:hypothetical protein
MKKTWVRKTLSVGVMAAGALLLGSTAAQATGLCPAGTAVSDGFSHTSSSGLGGLGSLGSLGSLGALNGTSYAAPIVLPMGSGSSAYSSARSGSGNNWYDALHNAVHGNNQDPLHNAFHGNDQDSLHNAFHQDSFSNAGFMGGSQYTRPVAPPINSCGGSSLDSLLGATHHSSCLDRSAGQGSNAPWYHTAAPADVDQHDFYPGVGYQNDVDVYPAGVDHDYTPCTPCATNLSNVSAANVPVSNVPVGNVPVSNVPVVNAPVGNVPVVNAPVGNVPVGNVPVGNAPVGNAPVGGYPGGVAGVPGGYYDNGVGAAPVVNNGVPSGNGYSNAPVGNGNIKGQGNIKGVQGGQGYGGNQPARPTNQGDQGNVKGVQGGQGYGGVSPAAGGYGDKNGGRDSIVESTNVGALTGSLNALDLLNTLR